MKKASEKKEVKKNNEISSNHKVIPYNHKMIGPLKLLNAPGPCGQIIKISNSIQSKPSNPSPSFGLPTSALKPIQNEEVIIKRLNSRILK